MLAHAQIVIATPNRNWLLCPIWLAPQGMWEVSAFTLNVEKGPVTALFVQAVQRLIKLCLIIHGWGPRLVFCPHLYNDPIAPNRLIFKKRYILTRRTELTSIKVTKNTFWTAAFRLLICYNQILINQLNHVYRQHSSACAKKITTIIGPCAKGPQQQGTQHGT
jgi:hypothetical protein